VFHPEDDGSNDKEYEIVFKEYGEYVSQLLDLHMKDMEISASQFEKACEEAGGVLSRKFHQTLFEQIWAANHFPSFKRMMIQINIDLQLWALEILAAKYGRIPSLFLPEGASAEEFLSEDDFFLREAKRRSLVPTDQVDSISCKMKKVMVDVEPVPPEHQTHVQVQQANPMQAPDMGFYDEIRADDVPSITELKLQAPGNISTSPTEGEDVAKSNSMPIPFRRIPDENLDEEEIRHRQDYLRRQRDKLLGLKREERERQAERLDRLEKSGRRPQTAKFIAIENAKEEGKSGQTRAYMRSLAARIKAEVSGKRMNVW
jgi:hypothetical protein